MIDYYLKVSSESELKSILVQAELATETEEGLALADGVALDIIGTIFSVTGEGEDAVSTPIDGFHANLRVSKELEDWQDLSAYAVEVNSPYRVWA
jgi:hypothetical protein